jgi:predicted ATPase
MGTGAADLATLVPEVREHLPDVQPPPPIENPEQARFRLFASVTAFLRQAAQRQPLLLVLDNLHGADAPSLLLLEFVAQELAGSRLLVIGTYRDMELSRQHPLTETLAELTRERPPQRLLLRGLAHAEVEHFVAVTAGVPLPQVLVEALLAQTEGNPLFLTEVVRLLMQEDA